MLKAFGKKITVVFKGNINFDFCTTCPACSCHGDWNTIDRRFISNMAEYIDYVRVYKNGYVIHYKDGAMGYFTE